MVVRRSTLALAIALSLASVRSGSAQAAASTSAGFSARPAWSTARSDSTAERILVELRLGRVAAGTVPAYRIDDELLLPVHALLELAEIEHTIAPSGRVSASWPLHGATLVIDPAGNAARAGERRVALPPHTVLVADAELYVASTVLGDLLGARFIIDWRELVVTLDDPNQLPIAQRIKRETARQIFRERAQPDASTPDATLRPSLSSGRGLVLDYSITAPGGSPVHGSSYALALGADLLGGSLEGAVSSVGQARDGRVRGGLSWVGVWHDARIMKQLRLGDAVSTGPSPRALRGVSLGNSPYLRAPDVGDVGYVGETEPGWTVEAYRDGQLVALDSANAAGRFGIRLPVQYGENPVDFVAYGPHGETYAFNRVYHVPGELLPAHRFEYGSALGVCTTRLCHATGNLDLRYGLSTRWTVRGGVEQFWRDTLPDLFHPYASITGALTNAWTLQLLGIANSEMRATVGFEPSLDLRLRAEYARYATGVDAPLLAPAGRTAQWAVTATVRPLGFARSMLAEASAERIEMTTSSLSRGRMGLSVQRGGLRMSPYLRVERDETQGLPSDTRPYAGLSASVLPLAQLGPVLGRFWWRGAIEASTPSRLSSMSAAVASSLAPGLRAEIGTSWRRGANGANITFALSADRNWMRSYTTVASQGGATPTMLQSLLGSVVVDRATKSVAFVPGPAVQRAGVEGRVFLDANGNGRWDPGELLLPHARVRVGARTIETDTSGAFRAWDIVPFEPVQITVDSMSLASPLWVPLFAAVTVTPGPNRFHFVDVPIAPGGVIEGRVMREADGARDGAGGTRIMLVNRRTGTVRVITTFSDGEFAALAVAPGSYELRVDERDLGRVGGVSGIVRVEVPPDADGARVVGVELVITTPR